MKKRQDLNAIIYLSGATLLFFWPIWLAGYRFPWGGGDLWGQLHPVWNYVAAWLRRGVFPLWSTQMMAGDPIIAEMQYGLLNPLNWPMFLASPIPPWVISLRGTASLWLAGVGMYGYLRHSPVWHLEQVAALVGATAYMFSAPFLEHLGHPQFNDTMAWLPWVLWGIDGAMRRARAIPQAGLALGLLLLAGHAQAALYALLLVTLYALWRICQGLSGRTSTGTSLPRALRRAGRLALVALMAACIAAPALLAGLERLPYTERALVVPPEERHGYEFRSEMWVDFISPYFHGRGVKGFWAPWDRVESGYVGVAALALAILGLLADIIRDLPPRPPSHLGRGSQKSTLPSSVPPRGREGWLREGSNRAWFLLLTGVLVYFFALGRDGPIYPLLDDLPLFDASWKTARAIYVLAFTLAAGAALGVHHAARGRRGIVYGWACVLLLIAVVIWARTPVWVLRVPLGAFQARARAGLRFAALMIAGTALLAMLYRCAFQSARTYEGSRCAYARAGLLLLLLAELVATGALADIEKLPQAADDPHAKAISYLKGDTGWFRVDVDSKARGLWSPAAVMAAGFEVPQGTGNPLEIALYNQFYWAIPTKGAPAYQLLGAKYIAVPKDALPGGEGIWPVFNDDPLIDVHLNTNALPRAWLVYRTVSVATLEEAYDQVFAPDFQPAQVATVKNGPALEGQGEGWIEVLAYGPNRAAFKVTNSAATLLVLSDLLYPGWVARVDGERAPLYATNGIFRGVALAPGEHVVDMHFRPTSLRIGVGLAAMAGLALVVRMWLRRRREVKA